MKLINLPIQHGKIRSASIFSLDFYEYITTGGGDGVMTIWSPIPQDYTAHIAPVLCVRYSPSGEYLVTAHDDGFMVVYKKLTQEEKDNLNSKINKKEEVINLNTVVKYKSVEENNFIKEEGKLEINDNFEENFQNQSDEFEKLTDEFNNNVTSKPLENKETHEKESCNKSQGVNINKIEQIKEVECEPGEILYDKSKNLERKEYIEELNQSKHLINKNFRKSENISEEINDINFDRTNKFYEKLINQETETKKERINDYKLFKKIKIHKSDITSLAFHANNLISVSHLGLLAFNELDSFKLIKLIKVDLYITGMFVNCSNIILKGSNKVLVLKNNKFSVNEIRVNTEYFFDRMSVTPDDKYIAVGSSIGNKECVEILGEDSYKLVGHVAPSEVVSFHPSIFKREHNNIEHKEYTRSTRAGKIKKTFSVGKSSTEQNFDEDFNIDWPQNKEISANPYYYILAVSSQDRSISMWTSLRNVPFLLLKGVSDSPVLDMKWVKNDLYFCSYSGKVVQLSFTEFDNPISINKKTSCKRDCVTNRKIVSEIISERDFDNYCIENDESMTSADKQEVVSKNASVNNLLENEIKISPIIKNGNKNINEISYDNSKNILLFKNKEYLIQGVTLIQNNKNYLILVLNNYIIRIYKIKENIIHLLNEYLIYDILLIKLKKHLLLILTPKHFILFNIKENTTVKDEYYFKLDDKITVRNGLIITKDNKKYVYDESLRVFRKLKSIDKENPKYFSTKRLQKYLSNQSKRSVLEEVSKRNKHK